MRKRSESSCFKIRSFLTSVYLINSTSIRPVLRLVGSNLWCISSAIYHHLNRSFKLTNCWWPMIRWSTSSISNTFPAATSWFVTSTITGRVLASLRDGNVYVRVANVRRSLTFSIGKMILSSRLRLSLEVTEQSVKRLLVVVTFLTTRWYLRGTSSLP